MKNHEKDERNKPQIFIWREIYKFHWKMLGVLLSGSSNIELTTARFIWVKFNPFKVIQIWISQKDSVQNNLSEIQWNGGKIHGFGKFYSFLMTKYRTKTK